MTDPTKEGLWKSYWPEFESEMKMRLEQGFKDYGDGSFSRPPRELLAEVEQELMDVVGWSFILWVRIKLLGTQWDADRATDGEG